MASNAGVRCNWRGWLVVSLVAVMWALVQGPAYNYSIFLLSFQREFNTSTALTGWIGSTANSLLAMGVIPAAGLQQWLSPRTLIMLGVFMNCGGFFLTSFVPSLWYAFLTYGVFVGLGMGFSIQAGISLCLVWFPTKHRARANAIACFGIPCGTLISARLLTTLISAYGWRRTFMITSGGIFVMSATATIFLTTPKTTPLKENHEQGELKTSSNEREVNANELQSETRPKGYDLNGKHTSLSQKQTPFYRHGDTWLWYCGNVLGALSWPFIAINLASYMDDIQLTSEDIALAIIILSIGQLFGNGLIVLFGDSLPFLKLYVIAFSFVICAFTSGFLTLVSSLPPVLVCSFVFGMAKGWFFSLLVSSSAEIFSKFKNRVIAILSQAPFGLGVLIGPPLMGGLFDLMGDYALSLLVAVACQVFATGCLLLIAIKRKIRSRRKRRTETTVIAECTKYTLNGAEESAQL